MPSHSRASLYRSVWIAAALFGPTAVEAQVPPPATLVGRVTAAGRPLAGATVSTDADPRRSSRTDSLGQLRLVFAEAGQHVVRARAIGHAPVTRTVTIAPGVVDTLDLVLTPSASVLNTVVTTATMQSGTCRTRR